MKTVQLAWQAGDDRFVAIGTNGATMALDAPTPPGDGPRQSPAGDHQDGGSADGTPGTPAGRGQPAKPTPSDLLLVAAGSCTAWDVVEILRKQRQDVTSIHVDVTGEQHPDPPWAYRTITLDISVRGHGLDRGRVERAVTLSLDSYCSVVATLRGVADVSATTTIDDLGPR